MVKKIASSAFCQLLAKISPPVNDQALQRRRLFEKIDSLFRCQVIWVSSLAGSGKTTLASTYLEDRGIPCIWYQVDIGDDDPATFFHYLGRAALSAVPRIRKAFPVLTSEYLPGLPAFTLRFFEDICSHVLSPSSKKGKAMRPADMHFALVFDNCQEVPDSSVFHTILMTGLARIPAQITVILISRTSPPPAYARLQANKQMGLLEWEDLRLSKEEVTQIICLHTGENPESQAIESLYHSTDGWAAGLTLMLGATQGEGFPEIISKGSTPEEIMYYFRSELFDRLDEPTRVFLLKTSFLPRMTVKMAQDLTGNPDASRILSNLHRNNFFIHKHFQVESCYEYHPLFREFLLDVSRESFAEDELASMSRSAACTLEKSGQIEAAVSLLKNISDREAIAPLVLKYASNLVQQGRHSVLQQWLDLIPTEFTMKNPWLMYWRGHSVLISDPQKAKKDFESAYALFKTENTLLGVLLAVSSITRAIYISATEFFQYDQWIQVIEDLFRTIKEFPSKDIEAQLTDGLIMALVMRRPDHPEIKEWVEKASNLLEHSIPFDLKIRLISSIHYYHLIRGDSVNMDRIYDKLTALEKTREAQPMAALEIYLIKAVYHASIGNHEECLNVVNQGLALARETGARLMDPPFLCLAAMSWLNENNPQKSKELLDPLAGCYDILGIWMQNTYDHVKAREALLLGDRNQALCQARKALQTSIQIGSKIHIAFGYHILAQALHLSGEHDEESRCLSESMNIFKQHSKSPQHFHGIMWEAVCAFDRGDDAEGYRRLKEAFAIGRENVHTATYLDIPAETAKLCVRAIGAGIEPEYARWLVNKRRFTLDPLPYHLEGWPWPVKIYTLGKFSLDIDDKPLTFSRKTQKRPLGVLKAILSGGGSNVSVASVADFLWPDADGDMAMNALATNLHRLRKLLGKTDSVLLQNGILSLNPKLCWIDAKAFELSLNKAEKLLNKAASNDRTDQACSLISSALALYKGEFLPDEDFIPNMLTMRGHLHGRFLQGLHTLSDHLIKEGKLEQARDQLERGIEIDECAEELYRFLMICMVSKGSKTEALNVYERLKAALAAEFKTEPSKETATIAERIRAGKIR